MLTFVRGHAQVEGLVGRMVDADGTAWWKIRWQGYSAADDTWETTGDAAPAGCPNTSMPVLSAYDTTAAVLCCAVFMHMPW
jgi:hypothetical protein